MHLLQQARKDLERADANCFAKRADFPRFKKKGRSDSFRSPDLKQTELRSGEQPPVAAGASAGCATAIAARFWAW